uniref:Secreted protein n=1 Tax=Physcomitrium patens TaxID=3218 RepID=A0A2K1LBG6_PHYPA|nr:hypothetical protein PHYPA_001796 [Physcomitrium patens]
MNLKIKVLFFFFCWVCSFGSFDEWDAEGGEVQRDSSRGEGVENWRDDLRCTYSVSWGCPILQQLNLKERLLQTTSYNWCITDQETRPRAIVMGVSG